MYEHKKTEIVHHLNKMEQIIKNSKPEVLEGNYFYYNCSYTRSSELYIPKQKNLFLAAKDKKRVLEIGFNAGHSSLLILMGSENPNLEMTIFDIDRWPYTRPCLEYIKSSFPSSNIEFVAGDSTVTLPEYLKKNPDTYDLIHIDGGHSEWCITNDIANTKNLLKVGGLMVIDDSTNPDIHKCTEKLIADKSFVDIDILDHPKNTDKHRILKRLI